MSARLYGTPPYKVFLVHGGPGAPGEMSPVARRLGGSMGVAEQLQSKRSLSDLIEELKSDIEDYSTVDHSTEPVVLVGYSWGAWLSYIFAAEYPRLVRKIILVSSGPFEASYAAEIMKTRLSRLNDYEKKQVEALEQQLAEEGPTRNDVLMQYGKLLSQADSYAPILLDTNEEVQVDVAAYQSVWSEAALLRSSGELLKFAPRISCPVTVIHGDYDPHPAKGVIEPLRAVIGNLKYMELQNCGHTPWKEQLAKEIFYKMLQQELRE
ncbi:alpha/beta hydrolase [Paenibacillus sp. HN-1]|uniref:alpha/beta fold hydrolase n=1 Tax=Paenibacillus TaxID=44249 RepID=UPI001CA9A4E4|nr:MULTISPECIES: alpha/beta hydrolase [Paenibacillus]MBY9077103.1 alpha/beta hydrolase [Paenibacillus sp. CGMCC 1.18879]MBY9083401.1 alpha/beta hydrolase [Paenibacillus sinensis]